MKPIHEELKEIRMKKGVSLEHISNVTKIRVHLLEKLEQGDFSIVPYPYIRAFLREYADVIGINPDRVIAKFERKINSILEEPSSNIPLSHTGDAPVTEEKIPPSYKEKETGKFAQSAEKNPETDKKSPAVLRIGASQDFSEHAAVEMKCSEIRKQDKRTLQVNEHESAHISVTSHSLNDSEDLKNEKEPSILSDIKEASSTTGSDSEKRILTKPDTQEEITRRKRYTVEEPRSKNTLFFIVFLILIVIAAIIIVWMNRSGSF